ncbi:hypothetical protein CRYUN_Cryun09bG0077400 [Craigia yunnanensis]
MAKGDDAVRRKKNKEQRKKLNRQSDSSTVSTRIASIIAAKKRRKADSELRNVEKILGMCFGLPTPDNPFNDRLDKKDINRRETNKIMPSKLDRKISTKRKDAVPTKGSVLGHNTYKIRKKFQSDGKKVCIHGHQQQACESSCCPSKYLILCLKAIENALHHDGTYNCEEDKPLSVNTWGLEFWKCYSARKDILETSGSSSAVEKIAWIASSAADVISRREKEGTFTLQAIESSRHTYTVLFCSLQSCEPKFLVSTPERLLQLVSLKAIDISGVSMLVFDHMESLFGGFFLDNIESIRRAISGKLHTVVFSNSLINASNPALQNLLTQSVYRLSLSDSISSQSACIIQSIHVCSSKEEKIMKMDNALYHAYLNKIIQPLKVLYIVGYSVLISSYVNIMDFRPRYSMDVIVLFQEFTSCFQCLYFVTDILSFSSPVWFSASSIDTEHISSTDLGEYDLIIIPDFVLSIDDYVQILTRMPQRTINGELHSCLTKDDAQHARPLIEILEQCGQTVPEALRNLSCGSSILDSLKTNIL